MTSKILRVLIVDDSVFFRAVLQKALGTDPQLKVIGTAANALEAEKKIEELKPDVVTMDVEMPNMRGTDFLKKLMPVNPVPVVLVSALNLGLFEALDAGAIDFVKKPAALDGNEFESFCAEVCSKIKVAATAKIQRKTIKTTSNSPTKLNNANIHNLVIAIGASTGGTEATLEILKHLPVDIPGIVVVQHMPAGFTKMYADRLNKLCSITVAEASNGNRVKQGQALIAAGDKHMVLKKDAKGYFVKCYAGDKVSGHCPSVDVLFDSVGETAGKNAIGVILTGMGKDGAKGLLKMRNEGAYTIGQDKRSSVVYGMPMVANDIGAVIKQASYQDIAGIIIKQLKQ
jgi:two-component system chemotaxis response regulator CheB